MSAAAPWSVKGIEPRAREIAKDLARRSGMTLGEWLNTMILEDDEDGVVPLSSRRHAADSFERRGRSRRIEDAYGEHEDGYHRLSAAVEAIASRLEASERRATVAIQGVDQAVAGLVRRMEAQDVDAKGSARRVDEISEELKESHRRLRRFEQEAGPQVAEAFGKMETSVAAISSRLYDIEERQRSGVTELRQRMDAVEKSAGPGVGTEMLAQAGARLDAAQSRTSDALRALEQSFADLDRRMRTAETRVEPESVREAARFEKLAETLTRSVESNRTEMMRRLDAAETEGRITRVEQAMTSLGDQLRTTEQRSAQGIEAMGREVLRIAQNLNGRVQEIEAEGPRLTARIDNAIDQRMERDLGRVAQALEQRLDQRLTAADDRNAIALEKLGGEITRISDRLSDRIAQSERRSAQALEDIGQRLVDSSSRVEQRYDRASGELAERMRQSEERTAQLLAEARDTLAARAIRAPEPAPEHEPPPSRAFLEPDPVIEPIFAVPSVADWSREPADSGLEPFPGLSDALFEPEPVRPEFQTSPAPVAERRAEPVASVPLETEFDHPLFSDEPTPAHEPQQAQLAPEPAPSPFGSRQGFGGADVSDILVATDPAGQAPAADPRFDDHEDFNGETEFVDRAALKAAAAAGRASSTRQAIDAARASISTPQTEAAAPKAGRFGLKRGGKSRLQERMDREAAKEGSAVRKILGASAVAMVLTAGAATAYTQLAGGDLSIPGLSFDGRDAGLAASAVSARSSASAVAEGAQLYADAVQTLEAGDPAGLETMIRAGEMGNGPAQLHLAKLYQQGENGVAVDPVKSRAWAFRASEGDDPRAMHFYGMLLYDGVGGPRNRPEALSWLKRAAEGGLVDSQYNVARLYENGDEGIAINLNEAYKWYLIAARGGDPEAETSAARVEALIPAGQRQAVRSQAEAFQTAPLA